MKTISISIILCAANMPKTEEQRNRIIRSGACVCNCMYVCLRWGIGKNNEPKFKRIFPIKYAIAVVHKYLGKSGADSTCRRVAPLRFLYRALEVFRVAGVLQPLSLDSMS